MESKKDFMVRGQKSLLVPATRRPPMMASSPMMAPPSPVIGSPLKSKNHAATYGAIMNELGHTKSRIFKVCCR